MPSKGPKITGIQYGFAALTLTHRDCSRFSETLDDIMHCRWWYLQTLCNFSLRNSFLILLHYFSPAALGELVILFPSWLLRDTATLRGSFYTQSCCQLTLISCKLVLQLFLICTFNFSGLLLLPVPTFLECVALMKSKMSQYLAWHFKMSHFNIWYVIYILLWIKYKFMRFVNYCFLFYSQFVQCPNFFGIGFVYISMVITLNKKQRTFWLTESEDIKNIIVIIYGLCVFFKLSPGNK